LALERGASRAGSGIAVAEAVTELQATIAVTLKIMAAVRNKYLCII
jgi:hypothetical protein